VKISESLWSVLRDLRETCAAGDERGPLLTMRHDSYAFVDSSDAVQASDVVFSGAGTSLDGWTPVPIVDGGLVMQLPPGADRGLVRILQLYVPLCSAKHFFPNRPFVIAHMAQSVDGRIATESGNSKWIGNEANLVHAHRLRALVDGVIVGGATAKQDLPSLDVRRVSGRNPARIVLSDTFNDAEQLPVVEGRKTILIRSSNGIPGHEYGADVKVITYDGNGTESKIPVVLELLRAEGISSILIEGGPTTTESFLSAGAVNWLQLHISPILFGSGKSVLTLPSIDAVNEAIRFRNAFYTGMDDGIMITGQV
jgi:riboflavin-specific deaminase-like protein